MKFVIADDEPNALEDILCTLKETLDEDAEFYTAKHAYEALELIKKHNPYVCFLDISMPGMSGINLANKIEEISPDTNVVFITGYPEYGADAWNTNAADFLIKPVLPEDIKRAMSRIRKPYKPIKVKCFGYFEVFINNKPVRFERKQSKELFAYLVDKRGAEVSEDELRILFWSENEDTEKKKGYVRNIVYDIRSTLNKYGISDVIINSRGYYSINTEKISCDYFDYINNENKKSLTLRQYMEQYSTWSRYTKISLFGKNS